VAAEVVGWSCTLRELEKIARGEAHFGKFTGPFIEAG